MMIKDLKNITTFSGITIESDAEKGTNNINATFCIANLTTTQRNLLENTEPYKNEGVVFKIKNGTMIYNITTQTFQVFTKGTWNDVILDIKDEVVVSGITGEVTLNTAANGPSIVLKNKNNNSTTTITAVGTNNPITYVFPAIVPAVGKALVAEAVDVDEGVITLGWAQ